MAAWLKPDYKIRKDFHSTFNPFKHEGQAPHSPLYRPGQEQTMDRKDRDAEEGLRHDPVPHLPIDDDFRNSGNWHQTEDRSPRLTNRIDPRYGSGKGKREVPSSPFANALQGKESKMSIEINDVQNREDNHIGQPYMSKDMEEYLKYRADMSQGAGYQNKPTLNGGSPLGSLTDRPEQQNDPVDFEDKPWTHRRYNTPNKMVDPRSGFMAHSDMPSAGRLRHAGALLFIRFPTGSGPGNNENIAVASQAFLKSKTDDMGGKFLGMARWVQDYGYQGGPREAMGVYHFPSPQKALLFFQYDTIIRQPDFPPPYGHAEMWIVSNAYLPDNMANYNTFLLSEIMLHDGRGKREFFEGFQKPFEGYLSRNGVLPFVVCSYGPHDRQSLRRHAYHHKAIVTCHLFQSHDHLRWLSDEEEYQTYRYLHNKMAEEKCMVFTLDKHLCP